MKDELTYSRNGDYLIPDLTLDEQPNRDLGKYGRMRKKYLEEHRPVLWGTMAVDGTLFRHLLEIEDAANARLEQIAGESGRRDGGTEEQRPAAMDRPDEHLQGPGGGSDSGGAGIRLTSVEENGQISLFPSEQEQIESISEAESVNETPSAFAISQDEIDHILRVGSNTENARMKIVAEYSKHAMDYADILKSMYHGGYGIETGSGMLSAWYAEDGIHLARGIEAEHAADAQVVSWVDAARRVSELLNEGRFATNVEIAEAPGFERRELAQALLFLARDLSDEAREQGYLSTIRAISGNGFDDDRDQLAALLAAPETRGPLIAEYRQFMVAWREDANLLRFSYHRPAELMNRLNELNLSRQTYRSDMAELPSVRHRITEDEIAHVFTDANADRKQAVYSFWQQGHSAKEKERFIREQYGTGGYNGALSHNFNSWLDYEGRGMRFRKQDCGTIEQRWANIVRRLDDLIANGRYLSPAEQEKNEKDQLEQEQSTTVEPEAVEAPVVEAAAPVETVSAGIEQEARTEATTTQGLPDFAALKLSHPDDIVLYQVGDFYEVYGYEAKIVAETAGRAYTMRNIPGLGHVDMFGFPVADLEQYLPRLRETHDVIVSGIAAQTGERTTVTFLSVDHEAEQAIDAYEREFGADGNRVFPDPDAPREDSPQTQREITQEDIDNAIRAWNGNIQSKQAVVRHMEQYARDKKTAEWLAMEYNATTEPFRVSVDGAETTLPWPKVQRRIAQLIKADRFYTEQEYDRFDDVDPIAVREKLEQGEESPFVQQVISDAEAVTQEQGQGAPEPAADDNTAAEWSYVERQKFLAGLGLTDEQHTIVNAMETAGFRYDPAAANPGLNENLVFRDASNGYPLTYQTWEEVYDWINTAELSAYPGLREQVQNILHPDQTPPDPVQDSEAPAVGNEAPAEDTPIPESETATEFLRDPLAPAYQVGDTVYLEDTEYRITEITDNGVQLLDPTLLYPIFRAENKAQFEAALYQDSRNGPITEYLPADLNSADSDLQDVLTWDGGLFELRDKEQISSWFRAGEGNTRIAERLSQTYAGQSDTMMMQSGENADYFASTNGVLIELQDRFSTKLSFTWADIVPILRSMYQQERDGFFHEPVQRESVTLEGTPSYQVGDTVTIQRPDGDISGTIGYVGDKDVRIDTGPYSWGSEVVNRDQFEEELRHDDSNAHLFTPEEMVPAKENFHISDDNLGVGGPKAKYRMNVEAIRTLKQIEAEGRTATAAEQEVLSRYVGWGGIPNAFDPDKEDWSAEYVELKGLLTEDEYRSARASTLNAHYTSPTVIKAVYEAIGNMGFESGNNLELNYQLCLIKAFYLQTYLL